jgi:hypothetical protein
MAGLMSPITLITQLLSDQGIVGAGFKINTYVAGSVSTPQNTWTDSTLGVLNSNPIILGSNGRFQNVAVWAPAGTVIKMVVQDANNNIIAGLTIDNIPLLNDLTAVAGGTPITLYGGTDTGAVNAYILNFTAPFFTAYANGITIFWIPANTNTGAATVNVNGLGVRNIVNVDGSALLAGQIQANQPTEMIFFGGQWVLINTGLYTGPLTVGGTTQLNGALNAVGNIALGAAGKTLKEWAATAAALVDASMDSGTFVGTLGGVTGTVTGTVGFERVGRIIVLFADATIAGTSNSTNLTLSGLLASLQPTNGALMTTLTPSLIDNTVNGILGTTQPNAGSNFVTFAKSSAAFPIQFNQNGFTNGGTKGILGGWEMLYCLNG